MPTLKGRWTVPLVAWAGVPGISKDKRLLVQVGGKEARLDAVRLNAPAQGPHMQILFMAG